MFSSTNNKALASQLTMNPARRGSGDRLNRGVTGEDKSLLGPGDLKWGVEMSSALGHSLTLQISLEVNPCGVFGFGILPAHPWASDGKELDPTRAGGCAAVRG